MITIIITGILCMIKKALIVCLFCIIVLMLAGCSAHGDGNADMQNGTESTTSTQKNNKDQLTTENADKGEPEQTLTAPERDENGVYLLSKAQDLIWLSSYVNDSNTLIGDDFSVKLVNDIDLSYVRNWVPIGKDGSSVFKGTFDGNGHTLSGLKAVSDDNVKRGSYVALIGISHNALIKDLTVSGFVMQGSSFVAGICASNGGVIENCVSDVIIEGETSVGGVCGFNSGRIVSCKSYGEIRATGNMAGGVCGYTYNATVENCSNDAKVSGKSWVGGICGYADKGEIISCINNATVDASTYAGGICGRIDAGISYTLENGELLSDGLKDNERGIVSDCVNNGSVSAGDSYAAGICGYSNALVKLCRNTGEISAANYGAGICAEAHRGALCGVANSGSVTVKQSYAAGIITLSHALVLIADNKGEISCGEGYAAGICAVSKAGGIYSCLSSAAVSAPDNVSGICLQSDSDIMGCLFVSKTVYSGKNSSAILLYGGGKEIIVKDCLFYNRCALTVAPEDAVRENCTVMTSDDMISGMAVCIMSSYGLRDGVLWEFTVGEESLPEIGNDSSLRVYEIRVYNTCDTSGEWTVAYSNSQTDIFAEHTYADGTCAVCGVASDKEKMTVIR